MSISREAMAEVLDIPAERIRCENCICADKWVNGAYICKGWGNQLTFADRYCTLFAEKEEGDSDG